MASGKTMSALLVLALATSCSAQMVPSPSDCASRVQSIGENTIISRLSACQGGATKQCCDAANGLLSGGGELALCLCNEAVLSATLSTIENNQLARAAGVTGAAVKDTLSKCNVPIAGSGACPSAAGGGGGGGVSVTAPGTTVGVAPGGGGVSVTAPGTTVDIGGGGGGRAQGGGDGGAVAAGAGKQGVAAGGKWQHPLLRGHVLGSKLGKSHLG